MRTLGWRAAGVDATISLVTGSLNASTSLYTARLFPVPRLEPRCAASAPHWEGRAVSRRQAALIGQGFDPVRIVVWSRTETGRCEDTAFVEVCRHYREVLACAGGGRSPCDFLFRSRLDGRYWRIVTDGLPRSAAPREMRRMRYSAAIAATRRDLDGLVILRPDGTRFRFSYD
jgi:hypothetical protein